MKRIMVVDDEILVRMGFRAVMDWEEAGCTVVGDASGGREALEKIPLLQPDLIFTDLRMDSGDGFFLMKECARLYPRIKFVVLSSYNDFDNVREALRCGAADYIFKLDMNPEQLRRLLAEIRWEMPAESAGGPIESRSRKIALTDRLLTEGDAPSAESRQAFSRLYPEIPWDASFRLITVAIDNYRLLQNGEGGPYSQDAILRVESVLCEVMGRETTLCPLRADRTLLLFLGGVDAMQTLQEHFATADAYIRRYLDHSVTAVMSGSHRGVAELAAACAENEQTLSSRYLLEGGRIHSYHAPTPPSELPDSLQVGCLECALRAGEADRVREMIAATLAFFSRSRGFPMDKLRLHLLRIAFALGQRYPAINAWRDENGHALETLIQHSDRLTEVGRALNAALDQVMTPPEAGARREEVVRALSYARAHLSEDISVATAARQVALSESYFAHIFKRDMNMGFTEWLNRERILAARQMLATSDRRVGDIAQAVGIDNPSYFSILFKKLTGKTPLEAREENRTAGS